MDPDESPFSRFGRTFWAAVAYITTSVVRFLRTESDTAVKDDHSSHEEDEDVTRETVMQKCREGHPEGTETEMAVGSPVTDVHSHQPTIQWEKCKVVTDHHHKETNAYSVRYSTTSEAKTELECEKPKQECFKKRDEPEQALDADGEKQIQHSRVMGDHNSEVMAISINHTEQRNGSNKEADSLVERVDGTLGTKLIGLDISDNSAAGNSGIAGECESGLSESEARGQEDAQEEILVVQDVDHGDDTEAKAPQSSAIHIERQDKAAFSITLIEQRQSESYASHTNQEEQVPDVTHNDPDVLQFNTTFVDQEEEIHTLTHRLVEEVVMASVELVNNELKTQEVHDEGHAQTSVTHLTSPDQVDSACDLREQQQLISKGTVESMTVWYDGEAEGNTTEVSENEKCEGSQQEEEEERLGGGKPETCAYGKQPWENTEEEIDDDKKSEDNKEGIENQFTEDKDCKAQDLERVAEQGFVFNADQNKREEEEKSQCKAAKDLISGKQPCEKEKDLLEEGASVLESDSQEDATDDNHLREEVVEKIFEEGYGDGQNEEHNNIENARVMLQDSPIAAEEVTVKDEPQAISEVVKEDLLQVGQCSQEMSANAQEMIDIVTDTSQEAGAEELVEQKAEPLMEERVEEGEEEEEEKEDDTENEEEEDEEAEERDEFEGLRPAEESEDEGVSIDPDDSEVQEAHEGWHSEEGENDFTDDFTSPVTEASDALLYEDDIPESDLIETGTDASLLREDAEPPTTDADVSLTSRPKDAERNVQWASQESEIAAGSDYIERDHAPGVLSATCDDGVVADSEFVLDASGMGLQQDVPEEITIDNSDIEREVLKNFLETSESKPRQQEEAEFRIKRQISNEFKSLDESESELEIKDLVTTTVTDISNQVESDIKPTTNIVMSSESELDMLKESGELITCAVDSEAERITVTEELVKETEKEGEGGDRSTAPQMEMALDTLQSQSGSVDVSMTSQRDALEEHVQDNMDLSERTKSAEGASEEEGRVTETSSTDRVMLTETDSESNFLLSETAEALTDKSLNLIQMMTKSVEMVEAPQMQADADILWPDHQMPTPEAELGETRESERKCGEVITEDTSKSQTQLHETGPVSSDEDKENRETLEESKAAESNLMWEAPESEGNVQEDEVENEPESVLEILTDTNEETNFDRVRGESEEITETNTDNMEEGLQKASPEDMGEKNEPDVEHMTAMQVEREETSNLDHQIPTREAELGKTQESERECGEVMAEDTSKSQTQELYETESVNSDENKENRETLEESKSTESNLMWEAPESEGNVQEDEVGNESESVMEILTDTNEETNFDSVQGESEEITETNTDNMEEGLQKASPDDMGEKHEPDVEHMTAMEVEREETSSLDGRLALKRKLENAVAEEKVLEGEGDIIEGRLPAGDITSQVSSLDFSIQKSRIAVKNPLVRPPKDPRTLLNLPSLEPTPSPSPQLGPLPGHPDKKPPASGVPLGGVGIIGVKLPGLGAGFPVLRKTSRGPKEEEKSENSPAQQKSETEQTRTEDTAEEVQTQSKPKWTPPKHAIGMGNPFMMAELKGKLKKPSKE